LEKNPEDDRELEQHEVASMLVDDGPQVCIPHSTSYPLSSSLALPAIHHEQRVTTLNHFPTSHSTTSNYPTLTPVSRLYLLSFIFILLLLFVSASVPLSSSSSVPSSSTSLHLVSINVNSLAHEMKIAVVENMVESLQPHALVIGETKSSQQAAQRLSLQGYELHETSG